MYLEDARPANDRTAEVPREMKLSVLRWDCYLGEVSPPPRCAPLHARGVGKPGGVFGASGDRGRGNGNSQRGGVEESAASPSEDDQ